MTIKLLNGDCREMLKALPSNSVDACVTDPPYGLSFMGKAWDYDVPGVETWREVFRVLKPGAHLLSFFGSRTYHRGVIPIEDAGFEIRDQIMWFYGSGFPKSHDISKGIDAHLGAEREITGYAKRTGKESGKYGAMAGNNALSDPSSDAAKQWEGWGTALKPAHEPIVVARKPFSGTVAKNVLAHGTGGLNIDGCRVGETVETWPKSRSYAPGQRQPGHSGATQLTGEAPAGRWPANVMHDGSDEVLNGFPQAPGQLADESHTAPSAKTNGIYGAMKRQGEVSQNDDNKGSVGFKMKPGARRGDEGSAARFFYCAKTSKRDRDEGCETLPLLPGGMVSNTGGQHITRRDGGAPGPRSNNHPTVKPTDLMRYLCRLVTPPGGTVLDPFMGSGSTGKAAVLEDFNFIGVELSPDYLAIAKARIYHSLGSDLV